MHRRHAVRLAALLASGTILLVLSVPTVLGKEGVSVTLAAPLPPDAEPGTTVPAFFTLTAISEDAESPLRGADVFVRLYGPTGVATEAAGVEQGRPGLYKALIEIPEGGALRAEFGIHGAAVDASGHTVASDIVWPYDGVLVAARIPPPVDPDTFKLPGTKPVIVPAPADPTTTAPAPTTSPGPATASYDPRLAAAVALGLVALVAGGVAGRRRRSQPTTGGLTAP